MGIHCSVLSIGIRLAYIHLHRTIMARNTSITIGDHFSHFVSELVRSGRYGSTSDVVRAGLRLLEEHEARIRALNDGLAVNLATPLDAVVSEG